MTDIHVLSGANVLPILKQLFAAYPNSAGSEGAILVYLRLLREIPPADLQAVIDQCILECKFLPTVAEIDARYRALTHTFLQPTATEAWGMVQAEIRRIGSWGIPHFEHPDIEKIVRSIGWLNLCQSETPGVERAHFLRMYADLQERAESLDRLREPARALLIRSMAITPTNRMKSLAEILDSARKEPSP